MSHTISRHPEFSRALRGYDRHQVDEYVSRLQLRVEEAERRARAAEAEMSSRATRGSRADHARRGAGHRLRERV